LKIPNELASRYFLQSINSEGANSKCMIKNRENLDKWAIHLFDRWKYSLP